MSNSVLTSVIISCFNQAHFLSQAIESSLAQSHPADEIVVVDDGSTDDTARIAARYEDVLLVSQRNRGIAAARNAGFQASTGSYLVFLDSDDRLLPNALEDCSDSLSTNPECAFVYGHVKLISYDGSPAVTPEQSSVEADHYLELLRRNYIWTSGAVMYRRSVLESIGGFNSSVGGSADYELNIRIARFFAVSCTGTAILEYRRHPQSMSRDYALMLKAAVSARRMQSRFVKGSKQHEKALQSGIRRVQKDYGEKLIAAISDRARRGKWPEAISGLTVLLRYYPQGFTKGVRRWLGAQASSLLVRNS